MSAATLLELSSQSEKLTKLVEYADRETAAEALDQKLKYDAATWRKRVALVSELLSALDGPLTETHAAMVLTLLHDAADMTEDPPAEYVSVQELILSRECLKKARAAEEAFLARLKHYKSTARFLDKKLSDALPIVREVEAVCGRYTEGMQSIQRRLTQSLTEKEFLAVVAEDAATSTSMENAAAKLLAVDDIGIVGAWQQHRASVGSRQEGAESITALLGKISAAQNATEKRVSKDIKRLQRVIDMKASYRENYRTAILEADIAKLDALRKEIGPLQLFVGDSELLELERTLALPPVLPAMVATPTISPIREEQPNQPSSGYSLPYRSSDEKMLFGVCGGLAHKWGWRSYSARLLFALLTAVYLVGPIWYVFAVVKTKQQLPTKGVPRPRKT